MFRTYRFGSRLRREYKINPGRYPSAGIMSIGYNFNVEIDYDISFTGPAPPGSMYTLQGHMECGNFTNNFFNLPNSGGVGTTTTGGNPYNNNTDCLTATTESLMCDNFRMEIQGPGISRTIFNCALSVLPVELVFFDATLRDVGVVLNWATATETDNDFFTVERSRDGREWVAIEWISGQGDSKSRTDYSYIDEVALGGISYYRIKQTDFNGLFTYTPTSVIKVPTTDLIIYPNPVRNFLYVNVADEKFIIMDINGQVIRSEFTENGNIDLSTLNPGTYFLRIGSETRKFIKI